MPPVNTTTDLDQAAAAKLAACLAEAASPEAPPPEAEAQARRAMQLADRLQRPHEQGLAGLWLCTQLLRQGRHADLLAESGHVLPQLQAPALAAERRELLRMITLSGSEIGAFDRALNAAHALARESRDLDDAPSALTAAYALAVCLERMGDSWQAQRLLHEALDTWDAAAPSRPLLLAANAVCAMAIGMAHRLRGTSDEAERQAVLAGGRRHGERALAMLTEVPDPVYDVAVHGNLGEVLLLQGHVQAAQPLLQRALALAEAGGLHAHTWRVQVMVADWKLAAGDVAGARAAAEAVLQRLGAAAPQETVIRARDCAYRACRSLGLHAQALEHLEAAERLDRLRTTTQLRAQSQLFVTRSEAQRAREQAERAHADALRHRERAAEYAAAAERDPLTGLGNRRHLNRRSAELFQHAEQTAQPVSLVLLDLDHFKVVNDRHGHAVGDRVLIALAQILRDNTRAGDVLVRHGGEEFVVMLPGLAAEHSAEIVERLRQCVEQHPWADLCGARDGITVSIGLSAAPPLELAVLLQRADEALYAAKHGGRNRLVVHGA